MDDDEEDYIFFGTPLANDIEDEYLSKKRAARELEVRDEKGRKRFHGAFTGGFSAGYFNTVGTKEGWQPATFVSSRSKNAERMQQNPEDFMDEEDLGEFGIATRKIHTSYKFQDSKSEIKKAKFTDTDNIIPGEAPLKDLIKPVRDSAGVNILKKLGWRPGQGVGPRVKNEETGSKVYGCSLPETSSTDDDPFALGFTFAPQDTEGIIYKLKEDHFGLGYTGLSKQSVLSARFDQDHPTSTKSFLKKDRKKLAITGQAFGVGAFEDDDEDIYSRDDMTQYDFSDMDGTSSTKAICRAEKTNFEKSSSGVLEGFEHAKQPSLIKKYYPPPQLPPDFVPKFSKLSTRTRWDAVAAYRDESHSQSHKTSSVAERSMLLGEKTFQSFQLKTPSILATQANNQKNEVPSTEFKITSRKSDFKPFANDALKQKRYDEFLRLKDCGDLDKLVLPASMTEWEKQQELEEFHRASVLFKPLSAALSSKFESRSHLSVEHEVMDAIEKARVEKSLKSATTVKKLVGIKNRQTFDWYPSSLLCKRFNAPNPYPDSSQSGTVQQPKSLFDHVDFKTSMNVNTSSFSEKLSSKEEPSASSTSIGSVDKVVSDHKSSGKSEENPEVVQTENEKPPMDFFKDIFENSSSEEEEITEDDAKQMEINSLHSKVLSIPSNTETESIAKTSQIEEKRIPKKAGFGVFANLDLDELNQRTFSKKEDCSEKTKADNDTNPSLEEKKDISSETNVEPMQQDDLYGPALPPNYAELTGVNYAEYQRKKHKGKHKHKHHKHKSKKKKKKHSHKSSDDSSPDSDVDISPAIILEKFKKLKRTI